MKLINFLIFIIILFVSVNAFAANELYFSPDSIHVEPGEEVIIDVMVSDMDSMFGAAIDIYFLPNVIEYVDVVNGDYYPAPILMGSVMEGNRLTIGIGTTQGECIPGSGTLFSIIFNAVADGTSGLIVAPESFWNCEIEEQIPFESIGECKIDVGFTDINTKSWGEIKTEFGE